MSDRRKTLFPLLVLLGGGAIAAAVFVARPEVERRPEAAPPPLVRVIRVAAEELRLDVEAQGDVAPRTASTLVAQVAGRVVAVAPGFADGGFFRRGEALVEIDPRDYRLAVSQAEAEVVRAQVRLEREEAEAAVARQEWEDLGDGEASPLTLRQPQLAEARAAVAAAEARLERARLDLERTTIDAPYDGRIRAQRVDLGQSVAPGTPLADVYATDQAEVLLPVAQRDLAFLDIELGEPDGAAGPPVTLRGELAGGRGTWRGRIVRTGSRIDPRTRMLALYARVDDPFRRRPGADGPPLPMGLFVDATIEGRTGSDLVALPRSALRDDDRVLVVDEESRLRFRDVSVLRREGERVLIDEGLAGGETVCVSQLETVVDGMEVRTTAAQEGAGGEGAR